MQRLVRSEVYLKATKPNHSNFVLLYGISAAVLHSCLQGRKG